LVEGFRQRPEALRPSEHFTFDGLGEQELLDLGAEGAETAVAKIMWDAAIGDRWSTSAVAELLGVTRQALHKRLRAGSVVGIPGRGMTWFPTWQFDRSERTIRPVVAPLVAAFRHQLEPYDARVFASWVMTVQPELETTPAEWVEAGRDDERLIRVAVRSACELAA